MKRSIPVIIIVAVLAFILGGVIGESGNTTTSITPFQQILSELKEGDSLTFSQQDMQDGGLIQHDTVTPSSHSIEATDKAFYFRGLSWWGLGGPEAAAKHQGIQVNPETGNLESVGTNRGYGILESFWSWVKSTFWTVLVIGLLLLLVPAVLMVIPATSGIGSAILRVIASVFGPLGSLVEWIRGKVLYQAPLKDSATAVEDLVKSGQDFKNLVEAYPTRSVTSSGEGFTTGQKTEIVEDFTKAHAAGRIGSTTDLVRDVKS